MAEEKQKKKFGGFFKRKKAVEPTIKKTVAVAKKAAVAQPVVPEPVAPPVPKVEVVVVTTPKKEKGSWLSRSKYFQQLVDSAFEMVDADGSGEVDEKVRLFGLCSTRLCQHDIVSLTRIIYINNRNSTRASS
jgi:hypothetical protein